MNVKCEYWCSKYIVILALILMQRSGSAQDFVALPNRITSVECSFIRKNTYLGFSKVARGRFCFDAAAHVAVYDYSGPFHFKFIIRDTVLYGIDKKKNTGYVLRRHRGMAISNGPYASIHIFEPYLRCVNADSASRVLRGSVLLELFFERANGPGLDVFSQDRDFGMINCVESFDGHGEMYEQTRMRYNAKKQVFDFPIRIVKRKKCDGMVTSDTVLISGAVVNKAIRPEVFSLPAGCRLNEVRDAGRGLFFGDK
jgi:hypothetical protein